MDKLLSVVLEAHGGLDKWKRVGKITARMSLGGPFWAALGWPDVYDDQVVVADPHQQRITFSPFSKPGLKSVLTVNPQRVAIEDDNGEVVEERLDPSATFPLPFGEATRWDALQVAYFASAATWNYLTAPFVFARPDVLAEEIEPWNEDGQVWRRLAVRFPAAIANHNADQVFYYDDSFMQRRMDYSPDVTGSPSVAHYTHDFRTFDGFVFPTRRLIHLHGPDWKSDQGFAPITIDVADVVVERA